MAEINVGTLVTEFRAKLDKFKRDRKDIQRQLKGIQNDFSKTASNISRVFNIGLSYLSGRAIFALSRDLLKSASNIEEFNNVVDVAFKESAGSIKEWAEATGNSMRRSTTDIIKMAGTFNVMLDGMNIAEETGNEMSKSLTKASIDLASLMNVSDERAFNAVSAAMTGEAVALKRLGFNAQEMALKQHILNKGIEKSFETMSVTEKTTHRYSLIMELLSDVLGDATRTQNSYANTLKRTAANMNESSVLMGQKFEPVIKSMLQTFNEIVERLNRIDFEEVFSSEVATNLFAMATGFAAISASTAALGSSGKLLGGMIKILSAGLSVLLNPLVAIPISVGLIIGLLKKFGVTWKDIAKVGSDAIQLISDNLAFLKKPVEKVIEWVAKFAEIMFSPAQTARKMFELVVSVLNSVAAKLDNINDFILEKMANTLSGISGMISKMSFLPGIEKFESELSSAIDSLNEKIKEGPGDFKNTGIGQFTDEFIAKWENAEQFIKNVGGTLSDGIDIKVKELITDFKEGNIQSIISSLASEAFNATKDGLTEVGKAALPFLKEMQKDVSGKLSGILDDLLLQMELAGSGGSTSDKQNEDDDGDGDGDVTDDATEKTRDLTKQFSTLSFSIAKQIPIVNDFAEGFEKSKGDVKSFSGALKGLKGGIAGVFMSLVTNSVGFKNMMDKIIPVINTLSDIIGNVLSPVFWVITVLAEGLGNAFKWFNDKIIVPIGNVFIRIMNGIISALNKIPFVKIKKLDELKTTKELEATREEYENMREEVEKTTDALSNLSSTLGLLAIKEAVIAEATSSIPVKSAQGLSSSNGPKITPKRSQSSIVIENFVVENPEDAVEALEIMKRNNIVTVGVG